jgi:hypothetical protein
MPGVPELICGHLELVMKLKEPGWIGLLKIFRRKACRGQDCGVLSRPNEVNVADALLRQAEAVPRKMAAGETPEAWLS